MYIYIKQSLIAPNIKFYFYHHMVSDQKVSTRKENKSENCSIHLKEKHFSSGSCLISDKKNKRSQE